MIEDRLTILEIEGLYGYLYDSKQGERWASLFTEDGKYQGRQLPGMPAPNFVQGRTNLARFCVEEPLSGLHTMHVPHIVIDDDTATVRVHFNFQGFAVDEFNRTQSRAVIGYYDVAYARSGSDWLIRRRVTTYVETNVRTIYNYEPAPADLNQIDANVKYDDKRR